MNNIAMTHEDLRRVAPSVFAPAPWVGMSKRYRFVPTITVVNMLEDQGYLPFSAMQSKARSDGRRMLTKHLVRFRRRADIMSRLGDEIPEMILVNAHDGTSVYKFLSGVFRVVCANGMVVQSSDFGSVSVRHSGPEELQREVLDATYRIMEASDKTIAVANDWKQIQLTAPQQTAFATGALKLRDGTAVVEPWRVLSPKRTEDQSAQDGTRSLWTTFNVVQEHMIKGGDKSRSTTGRKTRTRPIRSVDGDIRLNTALWTLTAEMAKIVTA